MTLMAIAIGILIMWNVVLTFLAWTAILASKKNDDEIGAIKRYKGGVK